ncbi:cyclic peptide export ABC transporter [Pandoraea pnomenusa]|jgi:putative ATP-binding cassette transporter|uniref:ABC transporter ATP-binding protein YojI n=1 Tax=Pandoraea pnomenusa TaxID=93220 RepID=A0A378YXK8_9BURK|nr:cyclic peptide export ABC transporter [Pandoraea pnomenusa]AIU28954.1 cyclic peptide transporter [Pandoraea pnomenusa]SUA81548.1 ABC transporter ATP-binding protein YojI [Pandoraea pnomenusa]
MNVFWQLVRASRWPLAIAFVGSLVSGFGNAGLVALINRALTAPREHLGTLGMQFLGLGALVLVTRAVSQTLFMSLGQRAKATLRMQVVRRIGAAPYASLERHGVARAITVLTQDLDTIVMLFVNLPALAMQGAVIAGCLIYLGYLSWQILLLAMVTIFIGAAGFRFANQRALLHLRGSRKREEALVKDFRALFDGAKELKLHRARRAAFIEKRLASGVEAVRVQRTRGYVLYAAAASWGSFILFAFIGLTLFVVLRHVDLPAPVVSGYALVFLYIIMPIEGVLSAMPSLGSARVALERIAQVETALPSEWLAEPAESDVPAFHTIVLDGVTHRYFREQENENFTLGPIHLTFRPGELVYLVGGNGSGKTTLAKLIVGLYVPERGRILVDGTPVGEAQRDRYRQLFSVVFSDFFLFEHLLGLPPDGLDAQASELLRSLQLDHKVTIEAGRFSTLDLSQGQRKRLALLVAYLEERPFYVFDEWAADQDPLFKDVFYRQMLPALKARGKCVLVITHDDRYFDQADRLIRLDDGQLREPQAEVATRRASDSTNAND